MNFLFAVVFLASIVSGLSWAEDQLPVVEFKNGTIVSCHYGRIPQEFKNQIRGVAKGKTLALKGDLSAMLGSMGIKPKAVVVDFVTAHMEPIEIQRVTFDNEKMADGCTGPATLEFGWKPVGGNAANVVNGFVKPDWLIVVKDVVQEYPGVWRQWKAYVPQLTQEIEKDGGFNLDVTPDFRKADQERIEHPALIFKDTRIKSADWGFLFVIASGYFPSQIYLDTYGQFQHVYFNDCEGLCD